MNRIAEQFDRTKKAGRKGFIPFVTAGDPDLETSFRVIRTLAEAGADVIELGVPFSDPMADGPIIQASSQRSLAAGTRLEDVLSIIEKFRRFSDIPIVLFSYLNPLIQYGSRHVDFQNKQSNIQSSAQNPPPGIERLASDAASAGADGILITDVVDEEAAAISVVLRMHGLDLISLIAPTTTDERLEKISSLAGGFLYAVSRTGVTGTQKTVSDEAEELVRRAKQFTSLPVAVGFGISSKEQIRQVWRFADAAVVGSAIVREIERSIGKNDPAKTAESIGSFVRDILPHAAEINVNSVS